MPVTPTSNVSNAAYLITVHTARKHSPEFDKQGHQTWREGQTRQVSTQTWLPLETEHLVDENDVICPWWIFGGGGGGQIGFYENPGQIWISAGLWMHSFSNAVIKLSIQLFITFFSFCSCGLLVEGNSSLFFPVFATPNLTTFDPKQDRYLPELWHVLVVLLKTLNGYIIIYDEVHIAF